MKNKEVEFADKVLKHYANENQIPVRSTSDLSPLETWLIKRLFSAVEILLIDSNEIWTQARNLDEKDFEQWMFEVQKDVIIINSKKD
jgi:hypothetical protein